ncbi:MAG: cation:proton antiporter [Methanoregula sp.]|jgi:NhaP-type Na+/H+ or K+/H+ antiporter
MDTAIIILFLGLLIFLGNILNRVFVLTKIPDLLCLIFIGLLIGPVLGLATPSSFGIVGPIFTTVTLAIILFEGGLHLTVDTIKNAFAGTIALTITSFLVTFVVVAGILYYAQVLTILPALMLGAIVGGTSSAIVIPLSSNMHLRKDGVALLSLESAITDVLCILILLTLIDAFQLGSFNVPTIIGKLISAFVMALILGVIGGIVWSAVYHRLGEMKSIFLTPAFLFVIYGVVDTLGYSGPIAALAFGITLGNLDSFSIAAHFPKWDTIRQVELTPTETAFLSQLVQLLKTFFFIYVGLSIEFNSNESFILGAIITLILFVVRIGIVYATVPRTIPIWDASVMAIMIPKGLAAAVLAAIPLQYGVEGGAFIETTTYAIILISIVICSVLVLLLERTPVRKLYAWFFGSFGKPGGPEDTPPGAIQKSS